MSTVRLHHGRDCDEKGVVMPEDESFSSQTSADEEWCEDWDTDTRGILDIDSEAMDAWSALRQRSAGMVRGRVYEAMKAYYDMNS